jgi:hypothetical protein
MHIGGMPHNWKALDEDYNFSLNITLIEGLKKRYGLPKIAKVLNFQIFLDSQLGSSNTK